MAVDDKQGVTDTAQQAALGTDERFRALIQHSADAIQLLSPDGTVLYSSDSVERVLGYKPEEIQGASAVPYLHPDDFPRFMEKFAELLSTPGGQVTLEYRVKHKNGSWVWLEATGSNYLHDPLIRAIVGNFRNITQRKQSEERQLILNEASEKLASSLDQEITLQEIAQLIVPPVADYCRIAILDEQQQIQEIAVSHIDPEQVSLVRELYEQYKDHTHALTGLPKLLSTGQPELISYVSESEIERAGQGNPEMVTIVHALGLKSYMGTPLIARDKLIGAITFSSIQPERYYTQDDLAFAQELARRIALRLDNARLYQEAQKAIQLRDDFISIASHELRTPVTSLKLYVQILQKQSAKRGDDSLARYFDKMDTQLDKLTGLIKDLLNVSRIESDKLVFQEDFFDLNEVIKETVEQIQMTTTTHRIRIEGSIPRPIKGDKDRIGQVLTNLLTNAIKYSPGTDSIVVRLTPEEDRAVVSVQDFGIGIEQEHQKHIFDRFYRVSDPGEKTYAGLGIGLFIANEIIKRHKGDLTVVSEKGKGSLFRFSLPYQ